MTKKFTLLQLFSLVDGRISCDMDDINNMLNHISDYVLLRHQMITVLVFLEKSDKPKWFKEVEEKINQIKEICKSNDFEVLIDYIKKNHKNDTFEIQQLKQEFNTSNLISALEDDLIPENTILIALV